VELTLQQALHYEQYPDQAGLSELVRSQLEAALKDKGLLADKNDVSAQTIVVRMDYQRIFAGEATPIKSSSVGPPRVNYTIEISQDGNTVAVIKRRNLTVNRGLVSNLKTLFTFYLGNTPETEANDVAILVRGMAEDISKVKIRQ
jgi:hypothetical protein